MRSTDVLGSDQSKPFVMVNRTVGSEKTSGTFHFQFIAEGLADAEHMSAGTILPFRTWILIIIKSVTVCMCSTSLYSKYRVFKRLF